MKLGDSSCCRWCGGPKFKDSNYCTRCEWAMEWKPEILDELWDEKERRMCGCGRQFKDDDHYCSQCYSEMEAKEASEPGHP